MLQIRTTKINKVQTTNRSCWTNEFKHQISYFHATPTTCS